MSKTTEAEDFAAEVPSHERLATIGRLSVAESAARIQVADMELVYNRTDEPIVRRCLAPPMHSARRARARILENLKALTTLTRIEGAL